MRCDNENGRSDEAVPTPDAGDGRAVADAIRARARQLGGPFGAAWAGDESASIELVVAAPPRRRATATATADAAGPAATGDTDGAATPRPAGDTDGATTPGEPDRPRAVVHYERLADAARSSGPQRPSSAARRTVVRLAAVGARGIGRLAG